LLPALAGVVLLVSGARAEDDDAERLRAWFDRLRTQLAELERRTGVLEGGKEAPAAVPDGTGRSLAAALLELTERMQELQRRILTLEKAATPGAAPATTTAPKAETAGGAAPAPTASPPAETTPASSTGATAPGAAEAGAPVERPAYLSDAALVKRIPRPAKASKVRFRRGGGAMRGAIDLPAGRGRSLFGEIPLQPGAEVFLLQGAPILAMWLTSVNDRRFLFQGEEYAYVRTGGRTIMSRAKTEGTVETTEHGPRYVETARFAMGLVDLLSLLERGGTITIGDVTFEIPPECIALLGDLCSCLHPDRVDLLLR